jgi:hypothetical protein
VRVPDGEVGEAGDPARGSRFDAVEDRALRRWTHGPPSPGVIRATAQIGWTESYLGDSGDSGGADAWCASGPDLPLSRITALTGRAQAGRPPRRPQSVRTRTIAGSDVHTFYRW